MGRAYPPVHLRRGYHRRRCSRASRGILSGQDPRHSQSSAAQERVFGCGNSTRNTAILRSNYRTFPGIAFYDASLRLYEGLTEELGCPLDFNQSGHFTLAHTDSSITGLRIRAENNRLMGVDSRMVDRDELRSMVPAMDMSSRPRLPYSPHSIARPGEPSDTTRKCAGTGMPVMPWASRFISSRLSPGLK